MNSLLYVEPVNLIIISGIKKKRHSTRFRTQKNWTTMLKWDIQVVSLLTKLRIGPTVMVRVAGTISQEFLVRPPGEPGMCAFIKVIQHLTHYFCVRNNHQTVVIIDVPSASF